MPSRSKTLPAECTLALISKPLGVHQQMPFAAPETFLAGSKPRSSPPNPVLLTLRLSTMAALGSGSRPSRTRALPLRRASCDLCQVPTLSATSASSGRRSSCCREVVGQQPPGAAAAHDLEDGVEDFADGVHPRPSAWFRGGQVGLYIGPLGIGKVGLVCFFHSARHPPGAQRHK